MLGKPPAPTSGPEGLPEKSIHADWTCHSEDRLGTAFW